MSETLDRLVVRLGALPADLAASVAEAVTSETDLLQQAVLDRMSALFKNGGGPMRDALSQSVATTSAGTTGTVTASGLPYLRIQEFGGVTRPHDIFPVNANVLAFLGSEGDTVFTKHVHHPGSRIPERSYMRSALDARRATITASIFAAVQQADAKVAA